VIAPQTRTSSGPPMLSAVLATLLLLAAPAARAVDLSVSGFATLGYSRSDQPYAYQRFIDNSGTFKRDSVAGIQLDAGLGRGFGATLQLKAAPATASDDHYEGTIAWAFLSYRPSNDWLFRAGKQRIPLYLYSESYDVGVTYDFARLPIEMYSIAPSNDATGLSFSKSWAMSNGDVSLDGYWGRSSNDFRVWLRDDIPPVQRSGAQFVRFDFENGGGLVVSYKAPDRTLRIGLHRAKVRRHDGQPLPTGYPFVTVAPGVGYYQVDPALPGPGVPSADSVTNTTLTLGAELALPAGLRGVGEFARSVVPHSLFAPQGNRGYVALLRPSGFWTPYLSYAFLRSAPGTLDIYRRINFNRLPDAIPGAAQLNAAQRAGAEQIFAYDQHSWALGTSYAFSPKSKLKAEVMRTRIGATSKLADAPPGSDIANQGINVVSFSYNLVF
jgi:hypothetical protein